MQNLAAQLLPTEKIAQCLRHRAPITFEKNAMLFPSVEVHKSDSTGKAHFENLIVCDRVWGCPICAAKISEFRRQVLTRALAKTDYQTILTTFTLSHHFDDSLVVLLDSILKAYRGLKSGRFWQDLKKDFNWLGDIRGLEVTYSARNGWHPHIHVLMVFENELSAKELKALGKRLKKRWIAVLERFDMYADWEHGCDIRAGDEYIREYVAKWGRLPDVVKKSSWTVEHEITKGHVKRSGLDGFSPFELLAAYGNGDEDAGELFLEYYKCFKGRHQLQWSRGLKELLNIEEIEAEIEEENASDDVDQMIVQIYKDDWRKICYNRARGRVLVIAAECEYGDMVRLWNFIADLPEPPDYNHL